MNLLFPESSCSVDGVSNGKGFVGLCLCKLSFGLCVCGKYETSKQSTNTVFDSCFIDYIFTELLRVEGSSGDVLQFPCLEPRQLLGTMSIWVLSTSRDGDLSRHPPPVFNHPHSKKAFLMCNEISCIPVCAHCLLFSYWAQLRRVRHRCLYFYPPGIYAHG